MTSFDDHNSLMDRIEGLVNNGYYAKAADLLRKILADEPSNRWFQTYYFTVLIKLDKLEEAKFWLKKIISRFENKKSYQVDAFYYKGLYYFLEDEFKRSMEYLKKCFEIDISYFKRLLHDRDFNALKKSAEFKRLITPSKMFTVNEYITLRLLFSKTLIYVCDELFLTCQKIAISIAPTNYEEYSDFSNIDEAIDFYKSQTTTNEEQISITPEEEFWGHSSNLQAWVENHYNTNILSKNLSFPLLKELSSRSIPYFTTIFKEELIERIRTGGIYTLRYFIAETDTEESYLKYLSELELFDNLLPFEEAEIIKNISKFNPLGYTLTTNLKDSRKYTYLRDEKKMHFCFENNHISELEILLDKKSYSDQYHKALIQIKNLKFLEELAIYYSINIHDSGTKTFIKYLDNFTNLSDELRNIVNTFS